MQGQYRDPYIINTVYFHLPLSGKGVSNCGDQIKQTNNISFYISNTYDKENPIIYKFFKSLSTYYNQWNLKKLKTVTLELFSMKG